MATKEIGHIGDVSYVEYGGGPVTEEDDGTAHVEYIEPPEDFDEPGATWMVYRVELEPEIPDWIDLQSAAKTVGASWMDVAQAFHSTDPMERAWAYEVVAANWGWQNLDNYPLDLGRAEVGVRYDDDQYPPMPTVRERTDYVMGGIAGQIVIDNHVLKKAFTSTQPSILLRVYEELTHDGKPLENFFVLSFSDPSNPPVTPFVRLAYFEPDEPDDDGNPSQDDPRGELKLTSGTGRHGGPSKMDREFPDFGKIAPEEMLRRMSKWVPG